MLWHAADEYIKYYLHQFDLNIDILLEIAPLKYLYFFKILKSSTFLGISMTTVLIKGGEANFSFRDFEPDFLDQYLLK